MNDDVAALEALNSAIGVFAEAIKQNTEAAMETVTRYADLLERVQMDSVVRKLKNWEWGIAHPADSCYASPCSSTE